MLARRELSEGPVRRRLERRGHQAVEVDAAGARVIADRGCVVAGTAAASARTETSVRRRGRIRGRLQIERAGNAAPTARRAVDEAFAGIDEDALIAAALDRRLRGGTIDSDRERRRLYRYLVGQGFDAEQVGRVLTGRRRPG
jgi:SOS response regulatory protein OraA/RecX